MAKALIKLLLKLLSYSELAAAAQTIYDGLNGNGLYTTPPIALATFQAHILALANAVAAWGPEGNRGSKVVYNTLLAARAVVENDMTMLAKYCETTTPYDGPAFNTAGFVVRNSASPVEILPAPQNLRKMMADNIPAGSLKLKWKRVKGAKTYILSRDPILPDTVVHTFIMTQASYIDSGLDSGVLYTYHVKAVNGRGPGVDSDVCQARAE